MKKFFAALLLVCLLISAYALAETIEFSFVVVPTSSMYDYQVGASGTKADGEQRFYVTTVSNGFSDNRDIYYISCDSSGALISNVITNSGRATYNATAVAGGTYRLAHRTNRKSTDSAMYCGLVTGRWTP